MKQTMMKIELEVPVNIFADMESISNANFRSIEDHIISLLVKDIQMYQEEMCEEDEKAAQIGFMIDKELEEAEDEDLDGDEDVDPDSGDLVLRKPKKLKIKNSGCKCKK